MKFLKTKHSRKRGAGLELAMMLFLAMTAITIMVVNTTVMQVERQKQSYNDLKETVSELNKMEMYQIAKGVAIYMNDYCQGDEEVFENVILKQTIKLVMTESTSDETQIKRQIEVYQFNTKEIESGTTYEHTVIIGVLNVIVSENGEGTPQEIAVENYTFAVTFNVEIQGDRAKYQAFTISEVKNPVEEGEI